MHTSYTQFYSTVFCLLYMFLTNLVVHQEHGIIYCITQFGTVGTIVLTTRLYRLYLQHDFTVLLMMNG